MNDSWIDKSLDALAAEDARAAVPPEVEAAVLQAWDMQSAARHVRVGAHPRRGAVASALLLTAAVSVLAAVLLQREPPTIEQRPALGADRGIPEQVADPPPSEPRLNGAEAPAVRSSVSNPVAREGYVIVPDPFTDQAALHVVHVRMPRVALTTLGVPIVNPDADGLVDVEMLVGDDGVARLIRRAAFVSDGANTGAER